MTDIPNGVGENMPDQVDARLSFSDNGLLLHCDVPNSNWPSIWEAPAAWTSTAYTQAGYSCVSRIRIGWNRFNTLQQHPTQFIYLDCGLWGDNRSGGGSPRQRNFGVVWGNWVALCNFSTSGGSRAPRITEEGNSPPDDLMRALTSSQSSVEVVKKVYSNSRVAPSWNQVYVLIPDLHLPVVTRTPNFQYQDNVSGGRSWRTIANPEPRMGRLEFEPTSPSSVQRWYDRYAAGDIFRGAGRDLIRMLDRLASYGNTGRPIHLVQVGDMYDLWIGLERYFEESARHEVNLENTQRNSRSQSQRFIDYWADRTHQAHTDLVSALNTAQVGQKSWLWGNHDNYLAAHAPVGMPARIREIRRGGIYIEHGHRGDDYNRDGAISGYDNTQSVFTNPSLRSWDPNRRNYFTTTAALALVRNTDFGVYAMGHTHSPFLTRVRVHVRRARSNPRSAPPAAPNTMDGGVG